jgi:hypothetical protein
MAFLFGTYSVSNLAWSVLPCRMPCAKTGKGKTCVSQSFTLFWIEGDRLENINSKNYKNT